MGLLRRDGVMHDTGEVAAAHRRAEQRLRLLLLGDGLSEPGLVKGEEARLRVTTALRHMREAFAGVLDADAELQEELLLRASHAAAAGRGDELLTPAEVARDLDVSVDAVYRAVKRNEIAALRAGRGRNGPLRIPASEVGRFRESHR